MVHKIACCASEIDARRMGKKSLDLPSEMAIILEP